jgi:hypothetical protein
MRKSGILTLGLLLSLTACSTVSPVPKQIPCPVPPVLDRHPVAEKSFTERMGNFLSGSLEKPTNSEQPSSNATSSTKP